VGIVPAHVLAGTAVQNLARHPFNLSPIGTGPYQFEALTASGGQIDGVQLRVAPVYRQRPEGQTGYQLDRLVFRTYDTVEAALAAFQAGEVQWPFPTRLPGAGEVIYGYEGNALFLCTIQVPPSVVPGERHSIRMDVSGLLCSADACLPFEAALQLTLPVTAEPPARDERWQKLFAEGRHRLPGTPAGWVFEATATPDQKYRIAITPPAGQSVPGTVHFFPFTSDAIKPSAPQILEPPAEGRPATLIVERGFADPGPTLKGVLTGAGGWGPEPIAGWGAVEVSIPVVTR
jgi:thiol:disulfide interchange protein DsbD